MDIVGLLPILVGVLLRRYVSAAANFTVMVAVFELGIFFDIFMMTGDFRPRVLVPYTVVAVIPGVAGIVGRRYLGPFANVLLMVGVSYVVCLVLVLIQVGELLPLSFLRRIFVSAKDLIPILIFLLVAMNSSKRRRTPGQQ